MAWSRGRLLLVAPLALSYALFAGCSKSAGQRRIEIWVSPKDKPEISVHVDKEFWSLGSDIHTFRATIGPKLAQTHTVLEGELVWSKENADQALFTFSLSNQQPVTVIILGVAPTNEAIPEKEARRSIFYPPGKHSFSESLFVKYTYD